MRWSIGVALAVLAGVGAARVQAQKAPAAAASGVKPVASVVEVMQTMTIPFSNTVFEAGGESPTNDKEWEHVRVQAVALAETGNLLMLGSRAKDRAAWLKFSRALVDAAATVAKAAGAKNADQLSTAADALYETCAACHKVYMKDSVQ